MKAYADIADLPEDDRIALIAKTAVANPGDVIGFVVEDDEKADRYIDKLSAYPLRVIERVWLKTPRAVLVSISTRPH